MRLSELHIDGFGHFRDVSIGPFDRRMVMLYGTNEAGKTTLLEFIRTILFGFPARNRDQHYPALAGGKHGGRLTVFDEAGKRYMIERHAGPRGGLLSVNNEAGQELGETALATLLGNASADVFKNVFAFSLDELQSGNLLQDANLNSQIYSAGLGATRLPDAFKSLASKRERIYTPRGRHQIIHDLLAALHDVDHDLGILQGHAAAFARLVTAREGIDTTLVDIRRECDALVGQQDHLDRLNAAWEDWVGLDEVRAKLADLPAVDAFPAEAMARLDTVTERVREARKEWQDTTLKLEKARAAATVEVADAALLAAADVLADLNRRRSAFNDAVAALPARQAELAGLERALSDRLRHLGASWNETRLEAFDASIEMRNEISLWQVKRVDQVTLLSKAEEHLQHQQGVGKSLSEARADAQSGLAHATPPQLTQQQINTRRAALRACRTHRVAYERQQDRHSRLQEQLHAFHMQSPAAIPTAGRRGRLFPMLLLLSGMAFLVLGVALGEQALWVGVAAALAFILSGGYGIALTHRSSAPTTALTLTGSLHQQIDKAAAAAQQALRDLQASAAHLQLDSLEAAAFDAEDVKLEQAQRRLDAWEAGNDALTQASRAVTRQERRIEQARDAVQRAASALTEHTEQWRAWLRQHGLPLTYTPDTMAHFWVQADTARVESQRVKDCRRQIAAMTDVIQQYRDSLRPLAHQHAVATVADDPASLATAADSLMQRLQVAQAAMNRRTQAIAQAHEVEQHWQQRAAHLRQAEAERAELLRLGGTDDAEVFRRKALQYEKRRELERQRDDHLRRLRQLSGPGATLETFLAELSQTDKQQIGDATRRLADRIGELEEQRSDLLQKRGETELRIQQLAAEERSSALRAQRNVLLEQLREQAQQWSRLRLAEALLAGAREKFQKERQPGVIRHAQRFFSTVTGHRYTRLYAPIGEQTITVEDARGVARQPDALSRGTREQLYLALRFGLICEFGQRAESLPVIVDEVLVNFDPHRARRVAQAFAMLSGFNQVLVFTCHPTIRDMFTTAYPDTQVIDVNAITRHVDRP